MALIAGNALILAYHYAVLPQPPLSRLVAATFLYKSITLDAFLNDIPAHIALTFNWFLAAASGAAPAWAPRPDRCAGVLRVGRVLGLDYTRDFTLLAFPLVLFVTERLLAEEKTPLPLSLSALPLLALLQLHLG